MLGVFTLHPHYIFFGSLIGRIQSDKLKAANL